MVKATVHGFGRLQQNELVLHYNGLSFAHERWIQPTVTGRCTFTLFRFALGVANFTIAVSPNTSFVFAFISVVRRCKNAFQQLSPDFRQFVIDANRCTTPLMHETFCHVYSKNVGCMSAICICSYTFSFHRFIFVSDGLTFVIFENTFFILSYIFVVLICTKGSPTCTSNFNNVATDIN